MKKIFNLLLVLIFAFLLVACEEPENPVDPDKDKVDYKEIIEKSFALISLPSETNSNLEFVEEIEYEEYKISLEWKTSNEAISSKGVVTLGPVDVDVVITLKGTLNDETFEKEIGTVKVLKEVVIVEDKTLEEALETITFPAEIAYDLELPSTLTYKGSQIDLTWTTDGEYISNDGKILYPKTNKNVKITVNAKAGDKELSKDFELMVLSGPNACKKASLEIIFPESINDDIEIPNKVGTIEIDWLTSDKTILETNGKCHYVAEDTEVTLSAGFYVVLFDGKDYFYDVDYKIIVKPYSEERCLEAVEEKIAVPEKVYRNIALNTTFDYGITGVWSSSNEAVLSSIGKVNNQKEDTAVTLTVDLTLRGKNIQYSFNTIVVGNNETEDSIDIYQHNIVDRVADFDVSRMHNVELKDNKLVLKGSSTEGYYESKVFNTVKFEAVVGSWSCITNTTATAELEVSIRINGKWTKYFTYGNWGLGLNNLYYNQDDTYAKMSVDEIMVKSTKADAVKYRITLRRDSESVASPKLSLVAMTLEFTDSSYVYGVTTDILPKQADNDLPKLYQYDVKEVGGSICSATTTTMLLKWKGHDFSAAAKTYKYANTWGVYEHGYMANLVADRGHNSPTFGNWTYNMVTAGAFGEDAYVARMYSWDEMRDYLANHGPLGASIKSSNGEFGYVTNGHLIVVRGYRINELGYVTVICNDPAVKGVYYEVRLDQLMASWRGVVYVLE